MPSARAEVATDTPDRFAKQLASHLGRRLEVDETPDGPRLRFPAGNAILRSEDGRLVMQATADDDAALAGIEDVLGRHLERFGSRQGLVVVWAPDGGGAPAETVEG